MRLFSVLNQLDIKWATVIKCNMWLSLQDPKNELDCIEDVQKHNIHTLVRMRETISGYELFIEK